MVLNAKIFIVSRRIDGIRTLLLGAYHSASRMHAKEEKKTESICVRDIYRPCVKWRTHQWWTWTFRIEILSLYVYEYIPRTYQAIQIVKSLNDFRSFRFIFPRYEIRFTGLYWTFSPETVEICSHCFSSVPLLAFDSLLHKCIIHFAKSRNHRSQSMSNDSVLINWHLIKFAGMHKTKMKMFSSIITFGMKTMRLGNSLCAICVCVCGKINRNIIRKHSSDGKVHLVYD